MSLVGCAAIGDDPSCFSTEVVVPERAEATGQVDLVVAAGGEPRTSAPARIRGNSKGGSVAVVGDRATGAVVAEISWKLEADPSSPLELPLLVKTCRRTAERLLDSGGGCIDELGARSSADQRLVFGHLVWWGDQSYSVHVDEPRLRMSLAVSFTPPVLACREL
ncbi:MAG: hypothetical protein U0183_25445 [Polyangiaceae bacterium]